MSRRNPQRTAKSAKIASTSSPVDSRETSRSETPLSRFSKRSTKSSPITSVYSETEEAGIKLITGKRGAKSDPEGDSVTSSTAPRKRLRMEIEIRARKRATSRKEEDGPIHPPEEEDEAYISEDELEPREGLSESEPSGSDFNLSESELSESVFDSDEEEAQDLSRAIRRSKTDQKKVRTTADAAGPSRASTSRGALELMESDLSDLPTASEAESGSESDTPRQAPKGKGKAKAKAKLEADPVKSKKYNKGTRFCNIRQERVELQRSLGRRLTYAEKTTVALYQYHPELKTIWGDVEASIPVVAPVKAPQPAGLKCTLLPFQQESLHWMQEQEQGEWRGGVLADEMGMGKTIQTIALLVVDRKRPNLIVAPTVALMQWKNEIASFTEGFKVLIWYGSKREQSIKELEKYDVVLTTYAVLESCYRKQNSGFKRRGQIVKESSALHRVKWNRIVLDEAHNIKERTCSTAKAAFDLKSDYKWCLSGTPLQNRVGELYSLIRFLGADPFSYYFCKSCECKSIQWKFSDKRSCDTCGCTPMHHTCFWNNEILTPIQKSGMVGPGETAFKKLKILLDRLMLRRTKVERADDLGLPPRIVIVRRDYFSAEEKELYLSLFSDAKRQFSTYLDAGTVLNNYSNIFSLITRMRQMACHPDLVLKSKTNAEVWASAEDGEATVCRLCNDIAEDAIQSRCHHIFDRECIKQYLNTAVEQTPDCPVCHVALSIDLDAPAMDLNENVRGRQGILGRLDVDKWRSSTKIEALVEELSNLRRQDATTKSLVFSQFVNFLDLIAFRLQRAGFKICRLEGTMSPQARDATIQHFMSNVDVTVFLVSLKAGGVALNLTEASRVYLMDSWWNPAVEFQAMDRIHRLGQHRPVQAIKLVVEDSIESRIVQLQEKKSAMVEATLSSDDNALGRLTPQDLGFLFRL